MNYPSDLFISQLSCDIKAAFVFVNCCTYGTQLLYTRGIHVIYISKLNSHCSFTFALVLYPEQIHSWFYLVVPSLCAEPNSLEVGKDYFRIVIFIFVSVFK
jgi:hypothetical protein